MRRGGKNMELFSRTVLNPLSCVDMLLCYLSLVGARGAMAGQHVRAMASTDVTLIVHVLRNDRISGRGVLCLLCQQPCGAVAIFQHS